MVSRRVSGGDRAVASTLNYVIAIAITTVLISSLLAVTVGYVESRQERVVRAELETIGNGLAADVAKADRLGRNGRNVTLRATKPRLTSASSYTATMRTVCPGGHSTCLELQSSDPRVTVFVPVTNQTALTMARVDDGWHLSMTGAPGSDGIQRRGVEPNIGIGRGVSDRVSTGDVVDPTNRAPIPGFAYEPYIPFPNETVTFVNDTTDLDGNLDSFTWDFGDGSAKTSGGVVTHTYPEPGRYDVTLTATDSEGATDNVTKQVIVSGLVYNDDALAFDADGDGYQGGVSFSVRNDFGSPVYVHDVLVDPTADTSLVGSLSDRDPRELTSDAAARDTVEVYVGGDDPGWVDYGQDDATDSNAGMELESGGKIITMAADQSTPKIETDDGPARIDQGSTGTIELTEFREDVSMVGRNVTVGLRYTVNGSHYASRFVLEPISGPNAAFDVTPANPAVEDAVTFDASASDDPQGTIVGYDWRFGDGANGTGQTVTHNYTTPGLYIVELTVTDSSGYQDSVTRLVLVENGDVVWAMNINGNEYTSQDGIEYEANPGGYYDWSTTDPVANTQDDFIYKRGSLYWGDMTYTRNLPDGEYDVTLKFNDPGDYGQMDVELEDQLAVSDLDVDEVAGGSDVALDVTRTVEVTDGQLEIELEPEGGDYAMISALVVERSDGGG